MNKFLKIIMLIRYPRTLLYYASKYYIKKYEGFSYKLDKNGEAFLLTHLHLNSGDVLFDVGANIGEWSDKALQIKHDCLIHTFELSPKTFETLESKFRTNECVKLNNVGLSNKKAVVTFKDYGKDSGHSTLIEHSTFCDSFEEHEQSQGNVITGDEYCCQRNIDHIRLLKLDVEAAEHLVLEGFSRMLKSAQIDVIQFEYGFTHSDVKFLIQDFYSLLVPMGYILGPLKPHGVLFMDFEYGLNDFNSGPNYVAVLSSKKKLIDRLRGRPIRGFPRT